MYQPLISVIIPAYNAESYIEDTINSVLSQEYKNYEIIVVNDGSTDNTLAKLSNYLDKIVLIDIKNHGVSYARNKAITIAKGEWVAFVDADDIWASNKLLLQMKKIGNCVWSHTNSYYIGENQSGDVTRADLTEQMGGYVFEKLILENFITTSTVLIKLDILKELNCFDEGLEALEDWKLWLAVSQKYPVSYCEETLAQYRIYQGSTSRKARKMLPLHLFVIDSATTKLSPAIRNQAYLKSYNICSYIAEDAADYRFSFKCAFKALRINAWSASQIKRLIRCGLNLFTA